MTRSPSVLAPVLALALTVSLSCDKKKRSEEARGTLPGAPPHPAALKKELDAALAARGDDYQARTRHKDASGVPKFVNRLLLESSPYLQQHAHNPVNWYPWGPEAFAAALKHDRPVLISIGYSTCHWCHVMEEESFENLEIAEYLNRNYIAIKIDREERPDLDSIYMSAVQALGQSGGWPLNVWLTPDKKPFFGGTYFPPEDGGRGRPGFLTVLKNARQSYDNERDQIDSKAAQLAAHIAERSAPSSSGAEVPGDSVLVAAARSYRENFDDRWGGMRPGRGGSKFPSAAMIRFLFRYARRSGDVSYAEMALVTLDRMAAGGIYDQLGGGFHRYSTDPQWLVPHFEKMLYDNAQLAVAYLEAYQITGAERYAAICREVLDFVARDMRAPGGGFYSAMDADSENAAGEKEEGAFFTWTPAEVRAVLKDETTAALALRYWGITERGNFEGRSVLHSRVPLEHVADEQGIELEEAADSLQAARDALRAAREKRQPPATDDKILASWNGLMISAYARAARVLEGEDSERYRAIAIEAADFIISEMVRDGRLLRSHRVRATGRGFLDDYAFTIAALIDLFEATSDRRWLEHALSLESAVHGHFEDQTTGGFYLTPDDHETPIAREKPFRDGAVPAGNSVHAMNLLRLHQLTGEAALGERADRTLRFLQPVVARSPTSLAELLLAVDFRNDAAKQIVVVAPKKLGEVEPFADVLRQHLVPNHVYVAVAMPGRHVLAGVVPLVDNKVPLRDSPTAYVCLDSKCELPTSDVEVFARQLASSVPIAGAAPSGAPQPAEK